MRTGRWVTILGLALALAGCSDSSPFRFRNVRSDSAEAAPKPAPALFIPNPPAVAAAPRRDDLVKPATFIPDRAAPMERADVNPRVTPLRVLHQRAAQQYAGMDTYYFRLKRREAVRGKRQPEEVMRVGVRRDPFSVHIVWLNEKAKGREVIYVQGQHGNKMHVLLEPSNPIAFLSRRHSFALDDPMVRNESRHPITNTGFGHMINSFGKVVAGVEKGDGSEGTVKYLGQVKRDEFPAKVEAVHQLMPPGNDPQLPKGAERWWYFDATNGLPVLMITHDATGEVEYYCHDHIQTPARLDDRDFDPNIAWRK